MIERAKYDFLIGIDSGVHTGYALYEIKAKKLTKVLTLKIHEAMEEIEIMKRQGLRVFVRFEDARLRQWFGKSGKEKWQGAGSVKRDAKIWEDYLKSKGIPFEAVAPKNNKTKLGAAMFGATTGWKARTSEHARDAAMLVFGY